MPPMWRSIADRRRRVCRSSSFRNRARPNASRAEARRTIQPRALRGANGRTIVCGRGGGHYKNARAARDLVAAASAAAHLWTARQPRAKRGAGLSSAPSRAARVVSEAMFVTAPHDHRSLTAGALPRSDRNRRRDRHSVRCRRTAVAAVASSVRGQFRQAARSRRDATIADRNER